MGASPRQCILQSGTLHLSPPQPRAVAENLIRRVDGTVKELTGLDLRTAPVSALLEAQTKLGLQSFFLQDEECLDGWQNEVGDVGRLLIGDTEYEVSPTSKVVAQLTEGQVGAMAKWHRVVHP